MKLFVWENVLHDYTAGMMVAIAPDRGKAIDALREAIGHGHQDLSTEPDVEIKLSQITEPLAFYVYGGG